MTNHLKPGYSTDGTHRPLPRNYAVYWYAARKAQVVEAVETGLIGLDEALVKYRLSLTEFRQWQRAMRTKGVEGLRAVKADIRKIRSGKRRSHQPRALAVS